MNAPRASSLAWTPASPEFTIYGIGIVHASVCSSLPLDEVERRMANEPTGIRSGWTLSDEPHFASGHPNPCPCEDNPETHTHYLFNC